jgi:hypothetical protein
VSLQILREILEDADLFGYIRAGAYVDTYDPAADRILPRLFKDQTLAQIQAIVWSAFYTEFCTGTIGGSEEPFALDKDEAMAIIGGPERFQGIALNIRDIFEL